ncbi:MAG: hypothetical protein JRI67_10170 [Deltaproteobacteria bacterium]|nr:hypothetical protein [Deltaproteobacteria bacterium]MBW2081201.1 hypothetical protein [Deltaproteobacteria bacterium]
MNLFVLVSTGYIGSNLISRLTGEKGISRVVALARNQEKAGELAERIEFFDKLEFAYGDFRHYNFDFGNSDAVIDLASAHNPYWGEQNPG